MLIPYRDENPTERFALVTFMLILANVAMFAYQVLGPAGFARITAEYGFVPLELSSGKNLPASQFVNPFLTLISYMFCHGSIPHLGFNMLFLWIFGNNVEDRMTRGGFLVFYLLTGVIAALAFAGMAPQSKVPLVGASGAISAILGAYLFMFPFARVYVWMLFFTMRLPAMLYLPVWFLMQILGFIGGSAGGSNVAWVSHIGGFAAGVILFKLFVKRYRIP
ncbi:MAG: rhomboid family intramembrane serine protease [Spirochaetes bacterium]|nr:MAG: rhomboid family intramembrane serine protease [Spirochaetota bacterium]